MSFTESCETDSASSPVGRSGTGDWARRVAEWQNECQRDGQDGRRQRLQTMRHRSRILNRCIESHAFSPQSMVSEGLIL